jgi:hypothetical protein
MTIHIDPATGDLAKDAGSVRFHRLSPAEANAFSTSHVGLVETASRVAGGGVMVNLQGRFRAPLFATIGEGGQVRIQHLGDAEPASEP